MTALDDWLVLLPRCSCMQQWRPDSFTHGQILHILTLTTPTAQVLYIRRHPDVPPSPPPNVLLVVTSTLGVPSGTKGQEDENKLE